MALSGFDDREPECCGANSAVELQSTAGGLTCVLNLLAIDSWWAEQGNVSVIIYSFQSSELWLT